jgi:hypothetical protein
VLSAAAALAYLALTLWAAFWIAVWGVFGCYEDCLNEGEWWDHYDAWQWDALVVLALAGALVGLVAVAASFWNWRAGAVLVGIDGAILAVAAGFLLQTPHFTTRMVVVWSVLVVGAGIFLVLVRRARAQSL